MELAKEVVRPTRDTRRIPSTRSKVGHDDARASSGDSIFGGGSLSIAGRSSRSAAAHCVAERPCEGQGYAVLTANRATVTAEGYVPPGVDDGRVTLFKGPAGAAIEDFRQGGRRRRSIFWVTGVLPLPLRSTR
jgi:hypothetical protein